MKRKILGSIAVAIIVLVTTVNLSLNTNKNDISLLALKNVEAFANNESSGGSYWSGYKNDPQSCIITESKRCDFSIYIPGYGYCKVGFDYTVEHKGMHNPCEYTGNPENICDYYQCQRNG